MCGFFNSCVSAFLLSTLYSTIVFGGPLSIELDSIERSDDHGYGNVNGKRSFSDGIPALSMPSTSSTSPASSSTRDDRVSGEDEFWYSTNAMILSMEEQCSSKYQASIGLRRLFLPIHYEILPGSQQASSAMSLGLPIAIANCQLGQQVTTAIKARAINRQATWAYDLKFDRAVRDPHEMTFNFEWIHHGFHPRNNLNPAEPRSLWQAANAAADLIRHHVQAGSPIVLDAVAWTRVVSPIAGTRPALWYAFRAQNYPTLAIYAEVFGNQVAISKLDNPASLWLDMRPRT